MEEGPQISDKSNNSSPSRKRSPNKKKKKKKKMKSLQIADPNRERTAANPRRRKRNNTTTNPNTENPISNLDNLDPTMNRLRQIVLVLNGIMVPLSSYLGMAVHIMALLGALQLDMTLLLPALIYFTAIWCLWSLAILTQPTFLILLYPFLMAAQGKLIYQMLVMQMEQQQTAFDELAPMFADQPAYKDSEEELEDDDDDDEDLSPKFEVDLEEPDVGGEAAP
jgi:hypothetical protein